jgi:PAS domain-containing protein
MTQTCTVQSAGRIFTPLLFCFRLEVEPPLKIILAPVKIGSYNGMSKSTGKGQRQMEDRYFYRKIVDEIPLPVYVFQDGGFKFINQAFIDLSGYERE